MWSTGRGYRTVEHSPDVSVSVGDADLTSIRYDVLGRQSPRLSRCRQFGNLGIAVSGLGEFRQRRFISSSRVHRRTPMKRHPLFGLAVWQLYCETEPRNLI